jgi:hypothetical protein
MIKIYTLIIPVLLCGCERWTVTKTDEEKLSIFERGGFKEN